MKKASITDLQQGRAIIHAVGEPHQHHVVEKLRSLFYNPAEAGYEREAQEVIRNMETEYVLNVANVLWADKYEQIPQYIKNYS